MAKLLRKIAGYIPGLRKIDDILARHYNGIGRMDPSKRGLYNSPLPDLNEVKERSSTLFRKDFKNLEGIDLRTDDQLKLLDRLQQQNRKLQLPINSEPGKRYFSNNLWYRRGDGTVLATIMLEIRPRKIIEIGSGFSSAVMLDTVEQHLKNQTSLTFVEPRPERLKMLLSDEDKKRVDLIESDIQLVPIEKFTALERDDILFVDSSHCTRIGSDVNYLLFELMPKLKPGVIIHFHDIYWPFEYPREFIEAGYSWNEAYILRAFLQYNPNYEIIFFTNYLAVQHEALAREKLPEILGDHNASFWLRKLS